MDAGGAGGPEPPRRAKGGRDLLSEDDTQAIAEDFGKESQAAHRAFYQQQIEIGQVRDKRQDVDLVDAADFDEMKAAEWTFNPEHEYYHGWSEGEEIVLVRRDLATGKRITERHPFEWYFYITAEDHAKVPEETWAWLCRRWARRVEPDPRFPGYVRVYVPYKFPKFDKERPFRMVGDPEFGQVWVYPFILGERPHALRWPRDRDRWTPIHHVVSWCQRKGIEPLEADLTPKQRFLTDYDIRVQSKYRTAFFDLETDDTVPGFARKELNRILSVAWEGDRADEDPEDRGFLILEEDSDAAEKALLMEFRRRVVNRYDCISAWNGTGFDFPVLVYRFHKHGIRIDWRKHLFVDPLPIFRRHYIRAGADAVSFALDSIGERVLGMNKVDWRTEFKRRRPRVIPKFVNLWRYEPELLEEYNRHDAEILRKLEQFTGFVEIERIFCRIANGFPTDWHISTKIDQLLLKKGFKEGHHFRTRFFSPGRPPKYIGAYVFPPKVGMHRNVAAFDFKSLYPSMVRAFNISPETLVKAPERGEFRPEELCTIPEFDAEVVDPETGDVNVVHKGGTTFRLDREGYISQMFVRTLERRKKYTKLQDQRVEEVGTTQDDLFLLYYRLAYSFKRLGLSFYGDMGNPRSRYYDTELAEAITLSGQFFIKRTAEYAHKFGYVPLYGDTDSIFIQLAPDDREWPDEDARLEDLHAAARKFLAYCAERYDEILRAHNCNLAWNSVELEYEDVYDRIFFVKKKRYAGRMFFHKGNKTSHVEVKGLELMRSDVSGTTRRLQKAVMDAILLDGKDGDQVEREVVEPEFLRCVEGKLAVDDVSISKGLTKEPEDYKTTTLHVKLAEQIREHGRDYFVGMKVEFVVTGVKPTLQGVTREEYELAEGEIVYEPEYYWDRVIYPATQRILEVVFPEKDWRVWSLAHRRRRDKVMERMKRWFLDPRKVGKAIDQIREKWSALLTEADLEELRRAPRVRRMSP